MLWYFICVFCVMGITIILTFLLTFNWLLKMRDKTEMDPNEYADFIIRRMNNED